MLEVIGVTKYFGALAAVKNVSFKIKEKEIVGLIGPNGSGKTTLFNLITGVYRPDSGNIIFRGQDITGLPRYKICRLGIARTYQSPKPFLNMSVWENVMVGALYGAEDLNKSLNESLEYLKIVGLERKGNVLARNLNICERKFLEIAMALATRPEVLLLDEPLSGLNPKEILQARQLINKIRDIFNIAVVWIEHIMRALKGIVDRIIVLNYGEKIAEGTFEEITRNKRVIEAYLGEKWVF